MPVLFFITLKPWYSTGTCWIFLLNPAGNSYFYFKKDTKVSIFALDNALYLGHSQNNEHPGRSYHTHKIPPRNVPFRKIMVEFLCPHNVHLKYTKKIRAGFYKRKETRRERNQRPRIYNCDQVPPWFIIKETKWGPRWKKKGGNKLSSLNGAMGRIWTLLWALWYGVMPINQHKHKHLIMVFHFLFSHI